MPRIVGKNAGLTNHSILEYQDYEKLGANLNKVQDGYDFFLLEEVKDPFLNLSGIKEFKILTENGIAFLQTSENILILEDEQLFMTKGKLIKNQNDKGFIKLSTSTFQRWDLYETSKEIDSSFLNIFYDIKFISQVEENLIKYLEYKAWHPIIQDVTILIEPKLFLFETLSIQ